MNPVHASPIGIALVAGPALDAAYVPEDIVVRLPAARVHCN